MALEWSNTKVVFIQVCKMLEYEDVQLRYECILQLSLFILMPERSYLILDILKRNC